MNSRKVKVPKIGAKIISSLTKPERYNILKSEYVMKYRYLFMLVSVLLFCGKVTAQERSQIIPELKGPYMGQIPPGLTPKVFAPGVVSTDNISEFSCTVSPAGDEFYFARAAGNQQFTILYTKMTEAGWTEPELAPFSGDYFNHEPYITYDNSKIIWGSRRPLADNKTEYSMWVAERNLSGWDAPYPLGFKAMYVTMSKNGILYYTGTGRGGACLARAIPGINKTYKHEILPEPLLSDYWDGHPCIAPDESYIIFDSENRPGNEECGLFISFRQENDKWTEPVNMKAAISKGRYAVLSPDSEYLFFSAPGNGGGKDIYWVSAKIVEEFRPKK